jgi:hypothetical protein
MIPIYMVQGLANGRRQERLAETERHRLIAAVPGGPGAIQRFALRVAGGSAALAPRAYEARAF